MNRIARACWWLKPKFRDVRDENAEAWETLRRTGAYGRFFTQAKAMKDRVPRNDVFAGMALFQRVRDVIYAKKPRGKSCRDWLPLGDHDPILKWPDLFLRDCAPNLDWVELGTDRQNTVAFNAPILPRQERAEHFSPMHISVCELEDDPQRDWELVRRRAWIRITEMKPLPNSGFRVLPKGVARRTYVVVVFELGQPAEALERAFGTELTAKLSSGGRAPVNYPLLWRESIDENLQPRTKEQVVLIPSRQSPFVMCWIPARNNHDNIQRRFHNAIREEQRPAIEKVCNEYWSLPEVSIGAKGEVKTLPAWPEYRGLRPKAKRKAARLTEFWLGLTAFECRKAGVKFDKSASGRAALAFFRANGLPDDPDLIRPALARFSARVQEVDAIYAGVV